MRIKLLDSLGNSVCIARTKDGAGELFPPDTDSTSGPFIRFDGSPQMRIHLDSLESADFNKLELGDGSVVLIKDMMDFSGA